MNKQKKLLLDALKQVSSKGPRKIDIGICTNVEEIVESKLAIEDLERCTIKEFCEVLELMQDLMTKWPKFSGDEEYPIPGGRDAYLVAKWDKTLWARYEHEYGALRWELLDWLIETLEKDNES